MNLVEESWIPVLTLDNIKKDVGLKEVFRDGNLIADLAVRPHERVALMRLLICIAQAALDGPKDLEEWEETQDRLPESIEVYLKKKCKESFDLFHDQKPFLQVAKLEQAQKNVSATSKLCFEMAAGNKSTVFDHRGNDKENRNLTDVQLTLGLLTFQNFYPAGLFSIVKWDSNITRKSGKENLDAPCIKGSMYHTFLKGKNLIETVCLNLLTQETVINHYGENRWGKPVWEKMPQSPNDKEAIENATETYLGRLVPMARWVKLLDRSRMLWGSGFKYQVYPDFKCAEPSATTVVFKKDGKEERGLLGASHDRSVWRQLPALLIERKVNDIGGPLTLENIPEDAPADIQVCSLLRNQATIEAAQESVFHVSPTLLNEIGRTIYGNEVRFAEGKALALGRAVEIWRKEVDSDWERKLKDAGKDWRKLQERLRSTATTHYWTMVENNLPLLFGYIDAIGDAERVEQTKKAWKKMVYRTAVEAYELVCGRQTSRQMRAFVLGLVVLTGKFKKKKED